MARTTGVDSSLLEAALIGYQKQKQEIEAAIADIQRRLGSASAATAGFGPVKQARRQSKHRISAEGRARIAAAQRRRWAAQKKKGA